MDNVMKRAVEAGARALEDGIAAAGSLGYAAGAEAVIRAALPVIAGELVAAIEKRMPRAHTYASENADHYRGYDTGRDNAIDVIRARLAEMEG